VYAYPQWHAVSFTLVAKKHIEAATEKELKVSLTQEDVGDGVITAATEKELKASKARLEAART
jgi:hypothetical protein